MPADNVSPKILQKIGDMLRGLSCNRGQADLASYIMDIMDIYRSRRANLGLVTGHQCSNRLKELDQKSITNDNWLLDMSCNLFDY